MNQLKTILSIALIFLVCIISITNAAKSEQEYQSIFRRWMVENKRVYSNVEEVRKRFSIFKQTIDYVENWNVDEKGFTIGINKFADRTEQEVKQMLNGYISGPRNETQIEQQQESIVTALPTTVDWRQKGAVTAVKDQGQCGSCWSFSTTGSIEGQLGVANPSSMVGLSEQELVDCSKNGNLGCNGGNVNNAFKWIETNKIESESAYPYVSGKTKTAGTCDKDKAGRTPVATITSYVSVARSESSLQQASATIGPISVAIDASHRSFQTYTGGVYYEPACSSTNLDHAVLVVGYGTMSGQDYWLVKNSWGTSWGVQGYIYMARNRNNNCGIATDASYPTGAKRV
eukprot:TRINITY_DN59_c0_g1_i1.p1 TRINITY_DN59_c0_g1~~TRINITY_DN59_c0_g1_i1.p1  ORF type:complete len:344 (-),score=184.15 TRINITY_DN59_c0_g1_i1:123-1154(-)